MQPGGAAAAGAARAVIEAVAGCRICGASNDDGPRMRAVVRQAVTQHQRW
jgi:hypothetical protein